MKIKNSSQDWLDSEILDKIILRNNRLQKFKAFRVNIDKQFYNAVRTNV